jgi:WD40 repeat protein
MVVLLAAGLVVSGCTAVRDGWVQVWGTAPEEPAVVSGSLGYTLTRDIGVGYEPEVIAVSPDGALIAVAGRDSSFVDLLNASTGARVARLVGHRLPPIGALHFSGDSRVLVSAGGLPQPGLPEPSVRVWDVSTGAAIDSIGGAQTAAIVSVAVSSDAARVASASSDSLKMWMLPASNGASGMWMDHTAVICGMAASPDLRVVATGGHDLRVLVRSLATMDRFEALQGHEAAPCGLVLSNDGATLVTWDFGSTHSTIRLWDTVRFAPRGQVDVRGRVFHVFFDGSRPIAVARGSVTAPGTPPAGNAATDRLSFISLGDATVLGEITSSPKVVATSNNGEVFVVAAWDGRISVFRRGGAR